MMASIQQQQQQQQPSQDETSITSNLAQDRPAIDAAVKSFLSLVCARSMTASTSDDTQSMLLGIVKTGDVHATPTAPSGGASQQHQALQVARAILLTVNSHKFPVHKTVANTLQDKPGLTKEKQRELLELSVVARLWNGLIQSKQKPSRFLGRRALRYAWQDMEIRSKLPQPTESDEAAKAAHEQQLSWLEEFEHLVFYEPAADSLLDNDAALLWDLDGGQSELAKRRDRRQAGATERGPVMPS